LALGEPLLLINRLFEAFRNPGLRAGVFVACARKHANFIQFLREYQASRLRSGNNLAVYDLVPRYFDETPTDDVMNASIPDIWEPIDGKTCRSICNAVGERLQRDLRFDSSHPSQYLQSLLDELEKRETTPATPAEAAGRPSAG
jgi:hypothetical protein